MMSDRGAAMSGTAVSAERSRQSEPWPYPATYAWYVVAVLSVAYVVSIVDRQILSLLVEQVKGDLAIGDTAFGLLHGFAFGLFYTLMGIPIAWLADRANRRNIIMAGVFLWSIMTAACGLARGFGTLFLARMGVGVGEAALTPAVLSILADTFPRERLSTPVSLYAMGAFWGTGMAYILGGMVVQLVAGNPVTSLPLLGEMRSWQVTFFIVAIPGLLLLPVLLTIREPRRRGVGPGSTPVPATTLTNFVRANWRALFALYGGFSLLILATVSVFAWMPAVFMRSYGWSASDIGYAFGLVVLIAGTLGINAGGFFTDWLVRRGWRDAPMRVGVGSLAVLVPLFASAPVAASGETALLLCIPMLFVLAFPVGAGMAAMQTIVPNVLRARMTAIFILVSNLTATVLGPPLVGLCTDYLFRDPLAIGTALALVCGAAAALAALVLAWGIRPYLQALGRSDTQYAESMAMEGGVA
jgi:MFS family permease